jgi:hypothetical protein
LQFRPWLQSFQQELGDVSNSKKRKKISMLVATKGVLLKATGRTFVCKDGHLIERAIQESVATGEGQTFWMKSIELTRKESVSEMDFE